jgi:PAS domain S-box-containing protein
MKDTDNEESRHMGGRKTLEEYLEEERQRLELIIESSPLIIFYKDRDGRFVRVNRAFAEAIKIPEEEFIGKTVFDLYSTLIAQAMTDDDLEVIKSGRPKLKIIEKYESASGVRWAQTDKVPILDTNGNTTGLIGFAQDITRSKQVEEALSESERKYRELAESITDIFFAVDKDLRYTYWNKASEELMGLSAKEAIGKSIYDVFPEDDATKRAVNLFCRAMETKKPQHFVNERCLKGEDYVFDFSAYPTSDGLCVYVKDITERRKLEKALEESELWYRLIFDNTPIGIGFATIDGRVITFNKAVETITGYSAEDLTRIRLEDMYVNKADRDVFIQELARNGSVTDYSVRLKRKGGTQYDAVITAKMATIGDKEFIQTILHDVTERKRAEVALRESEERYRALVEMSPEAIFVASEGRHVFTNTAGVKLLGASSPEQIIGASLMDVIHPDYRKGAQERMRSIMESGRMLPAVEDKFLRFDGTEINVEVRAAPLIFQGKPAIQAIVRDISERKRAEEAIRESEERYRSLVEMSPEAIFVAVEGKHVFTNSAGVKLLGASSVEEIIGKPVMEVIHPDYREFVAERTRTALETGRMVPTVEEKFVRLDSTEIDVEVRAAPLIYQGKPAIQAVIRDITERKQAEEEYRTIIRTAMDGFWITDMQGRFLAANQAYCNLIGYSLFELKNMSIADVEATEKPEEIARRIGKVRQMGQDRFETCHRCKNGEIIDVEISVNYLPTAGGRLVVFVRNITERKRAEKQLQQEKDKAQQYLDIAGVMLVANDLHSRISMINKRGCEILGYKQEELIGNNWFDIIPESARDEVRATFKSLMTGEVSSVEYFENPVLNRSGEERIIAWHNVLLKDGVGEIVGTLSSGEDVTERRRTEESLRASEERYRLLAENIRDVIWSADMNLRFTYVSPSIKYLGDRTAEEVMSMSLDQLLTPSSRELAMKVFAEELVLAEVAPVDPTRSRVLEVEFVRPDGSILWAELKMNFIRGLDGSPAGILGVMRDITDRKNAEKERRELEQKAQTAARLASIGELAAGVAHEINNPLTGVIGYAELLMQEDVPEHIKGDLEIIHDGAQRVAGIVSGLLKFARQTRPERIPVNINEIIRVTLRLRTYELETNNIKVVTSLASNLPLTVADPGQLQQVFLNLTVNAETEMKLAHGKGKLSVRTEQIGDVIRISFKDDGPGIARKNLGRIFDPFFTTRDVGKGTGLGLSICHGIINEHGGKIYAESQPGKGAIFIVELPVVAEKKRVIKRSGLSDKPSGMKRARILVVDDEPVVGQLLSHILEKEGYKVEVTEDGKDALARIRKKRYSLILLDIKLPGLSGSELYQHIRAISSPLAKRVVFMTGDVMAADTESFLARTKVRVITKPFNVSQLRQEIQRSLAKHRVQGGAKSRVKPKSKNSKVKI